MATGVHSSLRTASSASRRPPVIPPSRTETLRAHWRNLSPRARRALFLSLVVLAALILGGRYVSQSNDPRELYAVPLLPHEVREISAQLDEWEVEHGLTLTKDNLLVSPDQVKSVKKRLFDAGVPHNRPQVNEEGLGVGKTRSEQEEARQNRISARLAEQIEQMDGVQAATVNLALREQIFKEDAPSTASVSVAMRAGQVMTTPMASSIRRLVAGAVPSLQAENVELVDSSGQAFSAQDQDPAECLQQELQAKLDTYLESKAQRMLDKLPGQATVTVCAEYDLSQMQVQRTDVGGAGVSSVPLVEKTSREFFQKAADQETDEIQVMDKGQDGKSYENLVTARKNKSDESYTFTVHKLPRLSKISCSVLADSPLKGSSAAIETMIRTAVGIDESRGDQCSVVFIPMAPLAKPTPVAMIPPSRKGHDPVPTLLLASVGPVGVVFALLYIGGRRVRQQNVIDAPQRVGTYTESDLCVQKSGLHTLAETRVQSNAHLEARARKDPREVAELLKSTWLS